jgi:hypothetical protein
MFSGQIQAQLAMDPSMIRIRIGISGCWPGNSISTLCGPGGTPARSSPSPQSPTVIGRRFPTPGVEAIQRYLTHRIGPARGPLFLTRGNRGKNRDGRLETRSILRIVRGLGRAGRPAPVVSFAEAFGHHYRRGAIDGTRPVAGQNPGVQPPPRHQHAGDLHRRPRP